jgi:hypothetical protein
MPVVHVLVHLHEYMPVVHVLVHLHEYMPGVCGCTPWYATLTDVLCMHLFVHTHMFGASMCAHLSTYVQGVLVCMYASMYFSVRLIRVRVKAHIAAEHVCVQEFFLNKNIVLHILYVHTLRALKGACTH